MTTLDPDAIALERRIRQQRTAIVELHRDIGVDPALDPPLLSTAADQLKLINDNFDFYDYNDRLIDETKALIKEAKDEQARQRRQDVAMSAMSVFLTGRPGPRPLSCSFFYECPGYA